MSSEATVLFELTMRELWVLTGMWWRLPVIVAWHGDRSMAVISLPQIALLSTQLALLRRVLGEVGESRMVDDEWWMTADQVRVVAKEWTGNVEDAVLWNPARRDTPKTKVTFVSRERDDFIDFYVQGGLIQSKAAATAVFEDFCRRGLEWMVKKGRPFHLGWITLYPLPYRVDWLPIIHQISYRQRAQNGGGGIPKTVKDAVRQGWVGNFFRTDLLSAFRGSDAKGSLLSWTVGTKLHKAWFATIKRSEKWKYEKLGPTNYLRDTVNTVKNLLPGALEVLISYLKHASLPCAYVRSHLVLGLKVRRGVARFLPERCEGRWLDRWRGRGGKADTASLFPKVVENGDGFSHPLAPRFQEPQGWNPVVATDERGMPKVPDLQSSIANMRNPWESVDQPANGTPGTDGVPVSHALRESVS